MFGNFDVQAVVLHAHPFTDRHTSVNINETIDNMVNEFNIPEYKVNYIVFMNYLAPKANPILKPVYRNTVFSLYEVLINPI